MSIQVVQALWQIRVMSKKKKEKRVQIVTETPTIHGATFIKHCLIVHYGLRCVKMSGHLLLLGKPKSQECEACLNLCPLLLLPCPGSGERPFGDEWPLESGRLMVPVSLRK